MWKEYFPEFLVIFLAVIPGIFTERWYSLKIENNRTRIERINTELFKYLHNIVWLPPVRVFHLGVVPKQKIYILPR